MAAWLARHGLLLVTLAAGGYWFTLLGLSVIAVSNLLLAAFVVAGGPLALFICFFLRRNAAASAFILAHHDELTGLQNRRAFTKAGERMLKNGGPGNIGLVLLDIDCLKQINDGCGHLAGDELLVSAARSISKAASDQGAVYRIGGDEFAILVDRRKNHGLTAVLQQLRDFKAIFQSCGHTHEVMITYGYSSGGGRESLDELFRRADQRLYELKETRRALRIQQSESFTYLSGHSPSKASA